MLRPSALAPENLLERITGFPFVRIHPYGHSYHDDVRLALRKAVLEHRCDRYREVAHHVFDVLSASDEHEEVRQEIIYLRFAFDEESALRALGNAIEQARDGLQVNVTDTLVHLAE